MQSKTIRQKLLLNFGLILGIMVFLFAVSLVMMFRERGAIAATQTTENVRYEMAQNRLALSNYLLSGDPNELTKLNNGTAKSKDLLDKMTKDLSGEQRKAAEDHAAKALNWQQNIASKMIEKRKQVDNGNATVADLQIAYLSLEPAKWLQDSNEAVDKIESATQRQNDNVSIFTMGITTLLTVLGLFAGALIAFRTAVAITEPLTHLIGVARDIGESGDLDHHIDLEREDEIGELARTFNNMVNYLKEMAAVSEAIAGGDLAMEVEPRSKRDTLGNAFTSMTGGLRGIVSQTRDAAAQVAAGSNQVADASEDSD